MSKTVQQALQDATRQLQASSHLDSDTDFTLEVSVLLCHVLQKNRAWLYAWPEFELAPQQLQTYNQLVSQRRSGEPVSYLTGSREFWALEIKVTPATLIPRPETELLVEAALDYLGDKKALVLELGTGSGAIATALATERPRWQIIATDKQPDTLEIARQNFSRYAPQVESIVSNWFENVPDIQFDLIISNPPYLEANDPHLQQGDLRFEPQAALASGADGLDDIRTITHASPKYLQPDGYLMLEHGFNQAHAVQQLFLQAGLRNIHTLKDLAKQSRITLGQR